VGVDLTLQVAFVRLSWT